MKSGNRICVVIPVWNEEKSIGAVLSAIPEWVDDVVVVDNGSTDRTATEARSRGARVMAEPRLGYGSACLAGIRALEDPDVVVFLDGDYSDHPEDMAQLVEPILRDDADLVAGSRVLGEREPGALAPQARLGNLLACTLIRLLWGVWYTDLGPFRAIRGSTLEGMGMRDLTYGWMVEMQIKATLRGTRILEVPVRYRKRIGKSKITGTVRGSLAAGTKILLTIVRAAVGGMRGVEEETAFERVIVFTRYPEPGKTKTRLIPVLGAEGAAGLHRQMTEHTLSRVRAFAGMYPCSIEIRHEGGEKRRMREWLGGNLLIRRQPDGDLGERMTCAFRDAFEAGTERVVVIGTDCPGISMELLEQAFAALLENDLVIGPAYDGGYYLIGLRHPIPGLFQDIPWGTSAVLEKTLDEAAERGVTPVLLAEMRDVDRPEDLPLWQPYRSAAAE